MGIVVSWYYRYITYSALLPQLGGFALKTMLIQFVDLFIGKSPTQGNHILNSLTFFPHANDRYCAFADIPVDGYGRHAHLVFVCQLSLYLQAGLDVSHII